MNGRKILGIVVAIVGAICLVFSHYIAGQIAEGRLRIASGQRQVDTTNSLFNQSQYTKPIGGVFTGSGQERINAGNAQISYYESVENKLKIGGIVLIVIGAGIFFLWRKRSST